MLRILLTVVLPVALPLLLYVGYLAMVRRRVQAGGGEVLARWQEGPWPWLILAGVALLAAVFVAFRLTTALPPGTKLEAPRLIDGRVVPSRVIEGRR